MVVASAGRRIDAPNASQARFAPENEGQVAMQISATLARLNAAAVVSAAACGADILALEAARRLGLRCRVILPFDPARFRASSVVDRPGNWGSRYDAIIDELRTTSDVLIMNLSPDDPNAFPATNERILDEATAIAREASQVSQAMVIWEGQSRGKDDFSEHFVHAAHRRRVPVTDILTSDPSREISWVGNPAEAPALAAFFSANVDPDYISHGEIQLERALDRDRWNPDLTRIVTDEIRHALAEPGGDTARIVASRRGDHVIALALISFHGGFATLEDLVTERALRGKGIGAAMLSWIEREALAAGATRIFLESGLRNRRAHEFFQSHGFRPCSTVMLKEIGSGSSTPGSSSPE